MLEQRTADSAEAQSQGDAEAPRMATVTKARSRTANGKPAVAKRRENEVHDRIQRRAHELWEREGRPQGRENANWLQAENEIARARSQRVGMSR
jgi:hypothetical protein